jgi:hypothetical protein
VKFDRVALRIGIIGGAAVAALLVAGINRREDRSKFLGGALVLAVAVAIAVRLPLGGPYFPAGHPPAVAGLVGHYIGHYGLRNPLRVAIVGVGALIALFIAFGNPPRWSQRNSLASGEATAQSTSE